MEVDPPRLYHFPTSFHSQKVRLAMVEKGIPYRERIISLAKFEQCSPWFLSDINPHGQVPVLQDGEKYVAGSNDIIKYLDKVYEGSLLTPTLGSDKWTHYTALLDTVSVEVLTYGAMACPGLVPESCIPPHVQQNMLDALKSCKKSTRLRELKTEAESKLHPLYDAKIAEAEKYEQLIQSPDLESIVKKEVEKVREILREINSDLKENKGDVWLCSPDFTIADICLSLLLQRLKLAGYAADLWEDGFLPHVEAYYVRLLMRKTFRTVCVGDASYFHMMRVSFGDMGTMAFFMAAITMLVFAVWLGLYMAGKT